MCSVPYRYYLIQYSVVCNAHSVILESLCYISILLQMQMRRSMAKLELYRKFTNSLAVSVVLSIAWIGYEVVFPPSVKK